jgi:hypothetical protein
MILSAPPVLFFFSQAGWSEGRFRQIPLTAPARILKFQTPFRKAVFHA